MNIFNALSEGNGRISETNVTSFINYLLDSSNELNNAFFVFFVNLIDDSLKENKISDLLNISNLNIREQIANFSDSYDVDSQPEFLIKNKERGRRTPDILVSVSDKKGEDLVYLIIENKINRSSKNDTQLKEQFEYFYQSEDFDTTKPIYSLLITPNERIFESMIFKSDKKNHRCVWLKWANREENNKSIESTLRELIIAEHNAEISPIDPNTQYIIKSFIDFLCSSFSKAKRSINISNSESLNVVDEASIKIDETLFYIKRLANKTILIYDVNDKEIKGSVISTLRGIIKNNKLGIDLYHSTGSMKNTRVLGRDLINYLNANNL